MPIDETTARLERDDALSRYSRQVLFHRVGEAGQRRLLESSVVLIGCGALGAALAELLGRGGIGRMRIIDRDFLELNNLQRQTLFDEQDLADALPKAEAAVRKLRRINSEDLAEKRLLGNVLLEDLPSGKAGDVRIELTCTIDVESLVELTAIEPSTGNQAQLRIKPAGGLSRTELFELIAKRRRRTTGELSAPVPTHKPPRSDD